MADQKVIVQRGGSGIGFGSLLFIAFLVLKLCNVIDWSWWWVTSPLWIPPALIIGIIGIILICAGVCLLVVWIYEMCTKRKRTI